MPSPRGKIALVRPTLSDDRHALAKAITAVKQTEADLQKLVAAQDRCRDQRLLQSSALADRATILTALRDKETARIRAAYVNNTDDTSPLPQAEQAVTTARAKLTKLEDLEASISDEIEAVERRLNHQKHALDEAIGLLLVASPELAALNVAIRDCWARLRTLRGAAAAVSHGIPGSAPHRLLSAWEAVENINPGDPRDAVDHDFIRSWVDAVQALHDDPEATLPGG